MVKAHMAGSRFFKWFFEQAACGAGNVLEPPVVDLLKERLGSHDAIWAYFASENFSDSTGLDACFQEKFAAFTQAEFANQPRAAKAASLLYRALTGEFVDDFIYLASKPQMTIEEFFRKDAEHEIDNLRVAYHEFNDVVAETACGVIEKRQEAELPIPGDEDSEARAELTKRALKLRRNSALFHSLGGWMNQDQVYKTGGKMSTVWQNSRTGKFVGSAGKDNSLMLLSPDLFPTEDQFGKAEACKQMQVSEKDLSKALDWMLKAKGPATIVVAMDGRVRKIRRVLEDWADNGNKDPQRLLQGSLPVQPVAPPP